MDVTLLSDDALLGKYDSLAARDRRITAALLVYIAEIDERHLYLRRGYDSMRAFCMATLCLTEQGAAKRILVARLGRQMPQLFRALADGRLHMGAIRALSSRLNPQNVDDWIRDVSHKTMLEIERLIASRFPMTEPLPFDGGISAQVVVPQEEIPVERATWHAQPRVEPRKMRTKLVPISEKTALLQLSLSDGDQDLLQRARRLVPDASVGELF